MITRVKIKNFRNLADVDVDLGSLTVLVGRNGTGKSTFLDALRFIRDALRLGLETAITQRGGISAIRRWSPRKPYDLEISIELRTAEVWGDYAFTVGSGQQGEYRVKREYCTASVSQITVDGHPAPEQFEARNGRWTVPPNGLFISLNALNQRPQVSVEASSLVLPSISATSPIMFQLQRLLLRTSYYAIFPNSLREPQKPTNEETLTDGGENLSTALRQLRKNESRYQEFLTSFGRVVSRINDVRVIQAGGYLVTELKHGTEDKRSPWFPLSQESDGTLRLLGLLVALYQDSPHTLIGIEEPELTLYPGALAILSDVLREAAQRTQILITTQSPDLISRFGADELRVAEQVNGVTRIGPVGEQQREAINDQLFSAGDLLRIEGLHLALPAEAA